MTQAEAMHCLTDATRWRIVQFLMEPAASCCGRGDGVCACDIEALLDAPQPTVSYHMRRLVEAGFVIADKRGRWTYYRLAPDRFGQAARTLMHVAERAAAVDREPCEPQRRPSDRGAPMVEDA